METFGMEQWRCDAGITFESFSFRDRSERKSNFNGEAAVFWDGNLETESDGRWQQLKYWDDKWEFTFQNRASDEKIIHFCHWYFYINRELKNFLKWHEFKTIKMRPATSMIFTHSPSPFHLTRIVYFSILQLSILMASDNCESSKFTKYFRCAGQFLEFILSGGNFFWICKQNNFSVAFHIFSAFFVCSIYRLRFFFFLAQKFWYIWAGVSSVYCPFVVWMCLWL